MAEQDALRAVLEGLAETQIQQEQLATQAPAAPPGFLNENQKGFSDVLKNPDQAQVNAALAGVLGSLNPNSRAPLVSGAVSGLSALQSRRSVELDAKRFQHRQKTDALKSRIDTLTKTADVVDQIGDSRRGDIAITQADTVEGRKEREFTEQRKQNEIKNRLEDTKVGIDILKAGDIVDREVGKDEFGSPIISKVRVNPVNGQETVLSGGVSTTTQAQRSAVKDAVSKGTKALSTGNSIFLNKKLDQIFGPLEMRPLIGGLTEGAVAGDAKKLQADFDRFVENRVLDVARVLAPVTEVDVKELKATLAPSKTLGSAKEARAWYTGQFVPGIISELRHKGSPTAALTMGSEFLVDGISRGMSTEEYNVSLGMFPSVEETANAEFNQPLYTAFNPNHELTGKAVPLSVLKAIAKQEGIPVDTLITEIGFKRIK